MMCLSFIKQVGRLNRNIVWLGLGALLYAAIASYFVYHGRSNADEGFYLVAAAKVIDGAVPYKDFGFPQTPLLPYLEGLAFQVVGFGVSQQRWLNVFFSVGSLILVIGVLLKKSVGWAGGCVAVCALVVSFPYIYFFSIGKTYGFAQLSLVLTAYALFTDWSVARRLWWVSIFGCLAVGCRLTTAPAVAVLWMAVLFLGGTRLRWWAYCAVPLVCALALFVPVLYADLENAAFWIWWYHTGSDFPKNRLGVIYELWTYGPIYVLLGFGGLVSVVRGRNWNGSESWCLFAAVIGVGMNVLLAGTYAEYSVFFAGMLLLGAVPLTQQYFKRRLVVYLLPLILIISACFSWSAVKPLLHSGYLHATDEASRFLAEHTGPGARVVSSMPEVPLQAGRALWPRLEMGKFAITSEFSQEAAVRRGLFTYGELVQLTTDAIPDAIVLSSEGDRWNFKWTLPSLKLFRDDYYRLFVEAVKANYTLRYKSEYYMIFIKNKAGVL